MGREVGGHEQLIGAGSGHVVQFRGGMKSRFKLTDFHSSLGRFVIEMSYAGSGTRSTSRATEETAASRSGRRRIWSSHAAHRCGRGGGHGDCGERGVDTALAS